MLRIVSPINAIIVFNKIRMEVYVSLCMKTSKNRATRKANNSNIKHSVTMRSYLDNNFYNANNL